MARIKNKLYETKGQKPKLPAEVEVNVHLRNGAIVTGEQAGSKKLRWTWTDVYFDNQQHLHDIVYFEIA